MKVEVIKGVSHSIELIHGETSVCITPDEAENLITQLRAVVPVPEDVKEATNQYIGYPPEVDEGVSNSHRRQAFADGMLAERKRLMKDAVEVAVYYDFENRLAVTTNLPEGSPHKFCDKVKLIILK